MKSKIFYLLLIVILYYGVDYPQDDPFTGFNLPTSIGIMKFDSGDNETYFSESLYQALINNPNSREKFYIFPYSSLITIIPEILNAKDINDKLIKSFRTKLSLEFIIMGSIIDNTHISFKLLRTLDGQSFFEQILTGDNEEIVDKIIQLLTKGSFFTTPYANMVLVQGGEFKGGYYSINTDDNDTIPVCEPDEIPSYDVSVISFYIDKYEVTVGGYRKFCNDTNREMPSSSEGGWQDNQPIVNITWEDAKAYAIWAGKRLPTEVEWEYAASCGKKNDNVSYSGSSNPNDIAWFYANSNNTTHSVGTKDGNEWDIYDMSGNVWEWCETDYHSYEQKEIPQGKDYVNSKVIRGGSFNNYQSSLRVINRSRYYPFSKSNDIGFRCAKDVE